MRPHALRLSRLLQRVNSLHSTASDIANKALVEPFGLIHCVRSLDIARFPCFTPHLITMLSGRKIIYVEGQKIECPAGSTVAVCGPCFLDVTNEPSPSNGLYKALVIPIDLHLLETIRAWQDRPLKAARGTNGVIRYNYSPLLMTSLEHYLNPEGSDDRSVLRHRLMEVLLVLVNENSALLQFAYAGQKWSQRVQSIPGEELSRSWEFGELCRRLAVSEAALRRHLQSEGTSFRQILSELRLTSALMQVSQTNDPVYQVALDSGYQSVSQFTQIFRRRFGLPPKKLRIEMTAC